MSEDNLAGLYAFIAAENPDTGEVEMRSLGHTTLRYASAFADHLNENPVNDWSGDTPAVIIVAPSRGHAIDYLTWNFQHPRQRGATLVDMSPREYPELAPRL